MVRTSVGKGAPGIVFWNYFKQVCFAIMPGAVIINDLIILQVIHWVLFGILMFDWLTVLCILKVLTAINS